MNGDVSEAELSDDEVTEGDATTVASKIHFPFFFCSYKKTEMFLNRLWQKKNLSFLGTGLSLRMNSATMMDHRPRKKSHP